MPAQLTIIQYAQNNVAARTVDEYTTITDCKTVAHRVAGNELVWSRLGEALIADYEHFRFIAKSITFRESRYNF